MKNTILALSLLLGLNAYAGDNGGGNIDCKSDSGRTVVAGMAGASWNGMGPAEITYAIDNQSIVLKSQMLSDGIHIVDYASYEPKKSYVVGFKRSIPRPSGEVYSHELFQLRSVSGTFKQVRPDVFSFKAVIPAYTSIDPRKNKDMGEDADLFDQDIVVNCVLDVSL